MPRATAKRNNTRTGQHYAASQATAPTNSDLQAHPELIVGGAVNDRANESKPLANRFNPGASSFRASRRFASSPASGFRPDPVSPCESLATRLVEASAFLDPEYQVFDVSQPKAPEIPVVISCPHAGREYPETMMRHVAGGIDCLRGLEDFAVDRLLEGLPACGAPVLTNRVARAYLDVNRSASALDQSMFDGEVKASIPCKQVCSGYGLIPRLTADRQGIYDGLLSAREAVKRTRKVHSPFHASLAKLIKDATKRHGSVVLLDVHSMPSCDHLNRSLPDIVCGDVHGKTLSLANRKLVTKLFEDAGFRVGWNDPYSGGYITQAYGKARGNCQAVQIEISRSLYIVRDYELESNAFRSLKNALEEIATHFGNTFG